MSGIGLNQFQRFGALDLDPNLGIAVREVDPYGDLAEFGGTQCYGDALLSGSRATSHLDRDLIGRARSEEHTSELQSLMRISYAVFCLKKKIKYAHNK